jgi:hypothetical protein
VGQRQVLIAKIAELQAKLNILNAVPSDTFNFGTVVVFAAANNVKWYYNKTAEETWADSKGVEKDLATWILEARESAIGYFEVYELRVQPVPFYASA